MAAKTCYAIVKEGRLKASETKVSLVVDSTGAFPRAVEASYPGKNLPASLSLLGVGSAEAAGLAEAHVIEHDEHNIRRTFSATETVEIGVDLGAAVACAYRENANLRPFIATLRPSPVRESPECSLLARSISLRPFHLKSQSTALRVELQEALCREPILRPARGKVSRCAKL
jgi:hypothetical protein